MKYILASILALVAIVNPMLAALCGLLLFATSLRPMAQCNDATLILSILTGKIIEAFKSKVVELSYFSTDWSSANGPVKFNQSVISQIATVPTVLDHTPGGDLTANAQNAKDLVTDVSVKMDSCKKVVLKIPTVDAVALVLNPAFMAALDEGAMALGRAVVLDALTKTRAAHFSQEVVETLANTDMDTLRTARIALNAKGAATPRYIIGGSTFVGNIAADPRVASGDYHGQRTTADPYLSLVNLEGFNEVREFPNFGTNNTSIGTFTAATTDICTLTAHGLTDGDRVRVSSATTLPAGLSAATNYWVRDYTANTFKLAATNGGAAVDITDTGTGVHTLTRYEDMTAFAFEKRAIHIAVRPMMDSLNMARELGIPVPILDHTETDPETGLTFTSFMWVDIKTHDIYCAFVVMYGVQSGRALSGSTIPGTLAAGTALDYAGLRIAASANNA